MSALALTRHPYPVAPAVQLELIALWRSEWSRTDYDWLEALNGDYAASLATTSIIGRLDGQPVASATVSFSRAAPKVCLIGNVVTLASHRGRGFAAEITEAADAIGAEAGCRLAFLGSSRRQGNVYERCGFARLAGNIMRRVLPGGEALTAEIFRPGQASVVREAAWGDMPGLVHLLTQPLGSVALDYPRGLMAAAHADPVRCVSAFPVVHDEVVQRGGAMLVLASATGSSVFGLGTLTPGPAPAGRHRAEIDVATQAGYWNQAEALLDRLLQEAATRGITLLEAHVPDTDTAKQNLLARRGFAPTARLGARLQLRGGPVDVIVFERRL